MQRLRIRFSRGEELKFISHLDLIRLWVRVFRRAGLPLAYSAGFTPHPRISLAAPLAVGVTGQAELLDIYLAGRVAPHTLMMTAVRQLPPGVTLLQAYEIPLEMPALQAQVRYAEYEVKLQTEKGPGDIESEIKSLLSKESLSWQHQRDTGVRSYDLRALIDDIVLLERGGGFCTLRMRLRCDSSGSGRPEQVSLALGFGQPPLSIQRTRLILESS